MIEKFISESNMKLILNKLLAWLPFRKTKDSLMLVEKDGKPLFNITTTGEVHIYNKNPETGEVGQVDLNKAPSEEITENDIDDIISNNDLDNIIGSKINKRKYR